VVEVAGIYHPSTASGHFASQSAFLYVTILSPDLGGGEIVAMQPPDFGRKPKQSGDLLPKSEERFRILVEGLRDCAIFMLDVEGRVADWNAGAERIFGYREEEIVGKPGSVLFTPEDVRSGASEEELRKAVAEGKAEDERWHIRKDSTRFWASGFVRPIRDDVGNVRGFAKVARDITERKGAEEDRARLAAIVESSDDIIIGKTLEGIITSWNKGAERIYGYSAEEAVGQPISMLVPPERPNEIPRILESIRRGRR
jgi:PAS domain S-box-containing protein